MFFQEQYIKSNDELNAIKSSLSKTKKEYEEQKKKLEDAYLDKVFLEDDLNDLKDDKEHMIKSKKEKISNIFGYIHTTILALSCIVGCAMSVYNLSIYVSILNALIITSVIMVGDILISNVIEKILRKKAITKIENSEEYKKLLIEIAEKEEELSKIKEIIPNLEKEFNYIELRINMLNNKIEEIKDNQSMLKEEVFDKTMGIEDQNKENTPLTRRRIK